MRRSIANSHEARDEVIPNLTDQATVAIKATNSGGTRITGHHGVPAVMIKPHCAAIPQPATALRQTTGTAATKTSNTRRRPVTANATF